MKAYLKKFTKYYPHEFHYYTAIKFTHYHNYLGIDLEIDPTLDWLCCRYNSSQDYEIKRIELLYLELSNQLELREFSKLAPDEMDGAGRIIYNEIRKAR